MTRYRNVLTTRGHAFMAAGLTLLVSGMLLGFADISRIGVLLTALPLMAAVIARRRGISLMVTRTIHPDRPVLGQGARVEVVLRNTSNTRTRAQFAEERLHHLLGERPRFLLPPMLPGDSHQVDYQIRSQVRGRYRLGPLVLHVRDPYGLATTAASLSGSTDVLILPRIETLGSGRPRAQGVGTEGTIQYMIAQHGENDVAVRSYRSGDDLRHIHWPATAHRAQLMVRQEDRPARRRAVVVLDSRAAGHHGSAASGSFEWAVTATASIAAHLAEHRYALHLVSSETTADGTATAPMEIDDALACLAMARPSEAQELDEVLHCAQPLTSGGGGLVIAIVTDRDEAAVRRVAALRQPGGTGLMFLLDSASFGPRHPEAPTEQTLALAGIVAAAGWSTCVVGSDMTVAKAWNVVSCGGTVMVGAGR